MFQVYDSHIHTVPRGGKNKTTGCPAFPGKIHSFRCHVAVRLQHFVLEMKPCGFLERLSQAPEGILQHISPAHVVSM